jgi:hypothetical protein
MWARQACSCLLLLSIVHHVQSFQFTHQVKQISQVQMQMTPQTREKEQSTKRRSPVNKKQALKWVIQGVERCLAQQQLQVPPDSNSIRFRKNDERVYTYKRREDASLVDALYLLLNAKNQKETIEAGKRIEALMRVGEGKESRKKFPVEVTERVIKATASTGLLKISVDLLMRMLSDDIFPSPIAYIAVMNALRKNGRVSQMEELLTELATSCRRRHLHLKRETNATKQDATSVDVIAFNSFIAALCDAAVRDVPYSSNFDALNSDTEAFRTEFFGDTNSTERASSSEKFLYKAINLLKDDIACKKFELTDDPDMYSYNTILAATVKCLRSSSSVSQNFSENMLHACLRGIEKRGIQKDIFTYNSMIEIAIQTERDSEALCLIDEAIAHLDIDRYTINLALVPLLRSGRRHELMAILRRFYKANVKNTKLVASAFEAFLNTLMQNSEVDFAREHLFDVFFLPKRPVNSWTKQLGSRWPDAEAILNLDIQPIEPTTRHFNIMLTGYRKLYRPGSSRFFRRRTDGISEGDESSLIAQSAYSLLDDMLRAGVQLDSYSVSSLMAFPTSSKEVSSLLDR